MRIQPRPRLQRKRSVLVRRRSTRKQLHSQLQTRRRKRRHGSVRRGPVNVTLRLHLDCRPCCMECLSVLWCRKQRVMPVVRKKVQAAKERGAARKPKATSDDGEEEHTPPKRTDTATSGVAKKRAPELISDDGEEERTTQQFKNTSL
jgi:hypothetical protein